MSISYIEPAERAWARTRSLLFKPVDIERWLVIGFAAFLAGLAGRWAGISFKPGWRLNFRQDWGNLVEAPFESVLGLIHDYSWLLFGIPVALFALAVGVVFLWLSSRAKLVFIENMVEGRAAFVEPWKRFGTLGNSLFLWRLIFAVVASAVFIVALWPMLLLGQAMDDGWSQPLGALALVAGMIGALIFGVIVGYIGLFLESFVVPLMYRDGTTAVEAWRRFLPLMKRHLPEFLVYGLVVLLGGVAVFLCLVALAIMTCCILPLLLSVPYLHSVLLLPLAGFFRLYSVEFLAQFGPEWALPVGGPSVEVITPEPPAEPEPPARQE